MREQASVHTERRDGVPVVVARGEIDMATAPLLAQALSGSIAPGAGAVVLDLCQVSFFDSSGLHTTLLAHRRLADEGRLLAIACLPERQVARVFAVTGVGDLLSLHPDREAAIAAAGAPAVDGEGGIRTHEAV